MIFIAEVKTESPFGYQSKKSWPELFRAAEMIGNIISVHTDPHWGGSFELIAEAKKLTNKPILAKGIHRTDKEVAQAIKAGASLVLVVGRTPPMKYIDTCIFEPLNLEQLKQTSQTPNYSRVLWNLRDLNTGKKKNETFAEARKIFPGWLCQGSFIRNVDDVHPDANAILTSHYEF